MGFLSSYKLLLPCQLPRVLQTSLLDGRADSPYTLEMNHQITSQELARPFLLDLSLHVFRCESDVLCFDTG